MKTKIILFLLCFASLSVMGQGNIAREKCKTCGKFISQCQYKGKHPVKTCNTCGKVISQCQYKGKHPVKTCSTCGKFLSKCQYKGKHPQPEERCTECNKPIKQCSYNGKHPEPESAGYDVTFTCNVPSATLYIDGRSYGSAYEIYFLKTGNHSIKAVADGYNDYANHININRQNTSFVITMEMVTAPENPTVAKTDTVSNQNRDKHNDEQNSIMVEKENDLDVLGAQFSDINDSEKKMYGTSYGLKVTMVNEGKFREAGIPVNFCIQKVNDIKVKNVDDLNSIVRDARNSKSPVLYVMGFLRTGRKGYYAVPL